MGIMLATYFQMVWGKNYLEYNCYFSVIFKLFQDKEIKLLRTVVYTQIPILQFGLLQVVHSSALLHLKNVLW